MTRKDYVAIAAVIRERKEWLYSRDKAHANRTAWTALYGLEEELAAMFARDNPRFNRARFLTACAVEEKS